MDRISCRGGCRALTSSLTEQRRSQRNTATSSRQRRPSPTPSVSARRRCFVARAARCLRSPSSCALNSSAPWVCNGCFVNHSVRALRCRCDEAATTCQHVTALQALSRHHPDRPARVHPASPRRRGGEHARRHHAAGEGADQPAAQVRCGQHKHELCGTARWRLSPSDSATRYASAVQADPVPATEQRRVVQLPVVRFLCVRSLHRSASSLLLCRWQRFPRMGLLKSMLMCRMHVVESVDPNFLRTVILASKFDNR